MMDLTRMDHLLEKFKLELNECIIDGREASIGCAKDELNLWSFEMDHLIANVKAQTSQFKSRWSDNHKLLDDI